MVYVPGRRLGALYSPALSVVNVRVKFLCVSTIVTVAPTTAPPVGSVTEPRIRPALPWENAGTHTAKIAKVRNRKEMILLKQGRAKGLIGDAPPTECKPRGTAA